MKSLRKERGGRKINEPDLIPEIRTMTTDSDQIDAETIPVMVYCDPDTGLALVFGHNELIPYPRNKWYSADNTDEDRTDETLMMLESRHISGNWMKYLASKYDLPRFKFPGLGGRELMMDYLDFILRFWKRERYYGQETLFKKTHAIFQIL